MNFTIILSFCSIFVKENHFFKRSRCTIKEERLTAFKIYVHIEAIVIIG